MVDKTPRTEETRDAATRKRRWQRPSTLPTPNPVPGLKFRWIRTATLGSSDTTNVSSRLREGYRPVKAKDHPELHLSGNKQGNVEVGGLMLCSIPAEIAEDRMAVQAEAAQAQSDAVEHNYLRESDPRMPMLRPERSTRVSSFGND